MNPAEPFAELVNDYYEPLLRFAMSLTRSEPDALDLTQQTFYVWATKAHQLRDRSRVKTWLFPTLHRAFLVARRNQNWFANQEWEEVSGQLPDRSPDAAELVDSSKVLTALRQVDPCYQAAVALFYLEDCSYNDIATVLEVPIGTV